MYINFYFILVIVPLFIYKKNLFNLFNLFLCLYHLGISIAGVYYTGVYYTGVYFGISYIVSSIGLSSFSFDSYIIFSSFGFDSYIIFSSYFSVGRLSILTKFIISFYKIFIMSPLLNF